jgi:peptidoglycan LD-endopeptidase LytH
MQTFSSSLTTFFARHAIWLVPLLIVDVLLVRWLLREDAPDAESLSAPLGFVDAAAEEATGLRYAYPTDQQALWQTNSTVVYMPTASGRLVSALYGSTRTRRFGSRLLPAFHEGIDLAPLERGKGGVALDPIYAVADGEVAYISAQAGGSNYGRYIVLTHRDPVGTIYSLYAHLGGVERGLKQGQAVKRGDRIGTMGHSSSSGIPVARAHLHMEVGVILQDQFARWYQREDRRLTHGRYHGHNLQGIDPLVVWGYAPDSETPAAPYWRAERDAATAADGEVPPFSMQAYLLQASAGFELVVALTRLPDYFQRYPSLWQGPPFRAGALVMAVSEGGVPLRARQATALEAEQAEDGAWVARVDEAVLGRNGLRLVVERDGTWQLGRNGVRWLEMLLFDG